ncbi:hypothetical protein FKX85_11810 [Echinicola soli]|uniref:Outer membrane protein beta-barrel domain-containing protein n=1 Tax=Echinicola soli TaxID=2591634 RepID=A0A514CJ68_9BACT|nr:hypothetical protein [Echinicola soli]QDH79684.1 hypothetical protein FKX85_11810 [Echinicola soli]
MKKTLLLLVIAGLFTSVKAQEYSSPTRSVYAELGGAGLVYSFNYDFRFDNNRLDSWGIRVGAGGYAFDDKSLLTIPVQINRLFGRNNHYFEIGAGATFVNFRKTGYDYDNNGNSVETESKEWHFILDVGETPSVMGTLNFGYRRIPDEPGVTWRANLTPVFNGDGFWPLFAGIGIGYAF